MNNYCSCGCGELSIRGHFKRGHNSRISPTNYNGGKFIDDNGYILVKNKNHHRVNQSGYVFEHVLVVERALRGPLLLPAEVHHVNGDRSDNRNQNLLVCNDRVYHKIIEQRTRAYRGCGNATWRICKYCHKWDDPKNMIVRNRFAMHRDCYNLAWNKYYHKRHVKELDGK